MTEQPALFNDGTWTQDDETAFQAWYTKMSKLTGINPNPDDPQHFYDYRAAFRAGATPVISPEDNRYHWPSAFKMEGHPRMFIEGVNTKTGERKR